MGSSYFYLEFLLVFLTLLKRSDYTNPAIFALEYTLVPDASFPTQLHEVVAGYDHLLSITSDPSRICVSGDSAGATLILTLLLHSAKQPNYEKRRPGYAMLISPWVSLVSEQNKDTPSDYLDAETLELYGRQYAGSENNLANPLASPGTCRDGARWAKASPLKGFAFMFGSEEVLGPEARRLVALLRKSGCPVSVRDEPGGIHAWPVAAMFLSSTTAERQKGLNNIVRLIKQNTDVKET